MVRELYGSVARVYAGKFDMFRDGVGDDFSVFGDETEETAADNMSAYEIAVEKSLAEALSSREIEYEKITFDMNKTADDIIEISNVCLSVPYNSPSDDEIISAVTDYTGFSRVIIRIIRDEQ